MQTIRSPAVADMFYPGDADELHKMVQGFLDHVTSKGPVPKAIIAPHAGYIYSGPIAASAYARLRPSHNTIKRVILLGPAHRTPIRGLAACSAQAFATPLGNVPIDKPTIEKLALLPQVQIIDAAHETEHSLEVHLPFLQEVLDDFTLVPLVVGDATTEEVADVIEAVWGGPETLIVVSSDLSHFYNYEAAKRLDQATSEAIEALRPQDIQYEHACGRIPVSGLLLLADKLGLHAHTIDLRNSGDTAGPRDQVVGYGAYVFE